MSPILIGAMQAGRWPSRPLPGPGRPGPGPAGTFGCLLTASSRAPQIVLARQERGATCFEGPVVLLAPVGKTDMDGRIAAELAGTGLQVGAARLPWRRCRSRPQRAAHRSQRARAQRVLAPGSPAAPSVHEQPAQGPLRRLRLQVITRWGYPSKLSSMRNVAADRAKTILLLHPDSTDEVGRNERARTWLEDEVGCHAGTWGCSCSTLFIACGQPQRWPDGLHCLPAPCSPRPSLTRRRLWRASRRWAASARRG